MEDFEPGDRVRFQEKDLWFTGEITIVRESDCKILPDGGFDWDYTYYPKKFITKLAEEKDGH